MTDLTLQMYLVQQIICTPLHAADIPALAALDMPDGNSTIADNIDQSTFEHIRLKLKNPTSMEILRTLIEQYFQEIGYTIDQSQAMISTNFIILVSLEGQTRAIIGTMEADNILNITAT
jgi:predicted metalloenzyme YecM